MDSPSVVLDSSALLAYLLREPGIERVRVALNQGAVINAVNLAEVYTKLVLTNQWAPTVTELLADNALTVLPFTEEDALVAANLARDTRRFGRSLGDRACLATGLRLGVPILTGDREWTNLQVGVAIELFRL